MVLPLGNGNSLSQDVSRISIVCGNGPAVALALRLREQVSGGKTGHEAMSSSISGWPHGGILSTSMT